MRDTIFRTRWRVYRGAGLTVVMLLLAAPVSAAPGVAGRVRTVTQVLAASRPSDWRQLRPRDLLYMRLASRHRVVIELDPSYAPAHVRNIRAMARSGRWNGGAIVRVQDNFVIEWAPRAEPGKPATKRRARAHDALTELLPPELERIIGAGLPFTLLGERDVYAPEVGFSAGFPVARNPKTDKTWLVNCYGMVGVARGKALDSGSGAVLYAVIGQAPRQLDRNFTLVGRVVWGMQYLSTLPRGHGQMGFYQNPSRRAQILRVRLASDVPPAHRLHLEALRTDTPTFAAIIAARRDNPEPVGWFVHKPNAVDICNVPLPVRKTPQGSSAQQL